MRTKAIAALAAVAVVSGAGVVMMSRHSGAVDGAKPVQANAFAPASPAVSDAAATRAILDAGVPVDKLIVRSSGDIVVLRGVGDAAAAERAVAVVQGLGATRVANLITPPPPSNDDELRREAERQLASMPGLHGTRLAVSCKDGVVVVSGKVQHELQKDLARDTLRTLRGAREVRIELAAL
jgi:osmotically-inducible protein OsmY